MNDHTYQSQKAYAITGMDVYTHLCPNLEAFNHFLVSGKGNKNSREICNETEHQLENNADLFLHQLAASVKNVCYNGQNGSLPNNASLSLLIHNPFDNTKRSIFKDLPALIISTTIEKELGLVLDKSEVFAGHFPDAIHHAISLIEEENSRYVALISPFKYSMYNLDQSTSIGVGSLLFSLNSAVEDRYASLLIGNIQDHAAGEDCQNILDVTKTNVVEFSNETFTHFQHAPVIRLIGSILELNFKSRFSLLQNSPGDGISARDVSDVHIHPWFSSSFDGNQKHVFIQHNSEKLSIEENHQFNRNSHESFMNFGYYLLPVPIDEPESGVQKIKELISILSDSEDLEEITNQSLKIVAEQRTVRNVLVVLGESGQDLINELERAQSGIIKSFENGKDWQTPNGSYFTPNPLGPNEKICFVYPGAFSSYIGMGSEIFYLFPDLHEKLQTITADPATSINESVIYPVNASPNEVAKLQDHLNSYPIKMITSGVCFSFLLTAILRDIFKVRSDSAFGYSLGENSMMFAMGIWKQADAMRTSLEVSPIFHSKVSGSQEAIRQFWKMPPKEDKKNGASIWANYVLMASPEKVKSAISDEDRVYITHINTPRQVVIGGEKDACRRVADTVKCMHLQAPYHHAIHCDPVVSEYDGFVRLHNWPVENRHTIPVYSAANYAPLEYKSESIAHSFAKMLTNPIDFPRLINLAYQDGARIFIELGAGSNCSKWVGATLKGKPHATMSINHNNVSDHVSILRLLARLISHKVSLNLDPLRSISHD